MNRVPTRAPTRLKEMLGHPIEVWSEYLSMLKSETKCRIREETRVSGVGLFVS